MIDSYLGRLRNVSDGMSALSDLLRRMHNDLADVILHLKDEADYINEEMNKFEQGFAYARDKTSSLGRKKPVLHGVEPQRNKRKSKQASRSPVTHE